MPLTRVIVIQDADALRVTEYPASCTMMLSAVCASDDTPISRAFQTGRALPSPAWVMVTVSLPVDHVMVMEAVRGESDGLAAAATA